nr:glycosyltransferase [Oxalobacteraceae bacterium]
MVLESEINQTTLAGLLSVVVPFYNEEAIAFEACQELITALQKAAIDWELILVDDGSTDQTLIELSKAIRGVPQARI